MNIFQAAPSVSDSGQQPVQQQLTPQQKLAIALMQQGNQINQSGSYSPANGVNQLFQGYLGGALMRPQKPNSIGQTALNGANASDDPIGALASIKGWADPTQ